MPTEIINITCLKIKYRQRQHNSKQRIAAVAFGSFDCLYILLYVSLDFMILASPVRPNSMHLVTVTHWLFI